MPAAVSLSPPAAPIVGQPARHSATADRTAATAPRHPMAAATAQADAVSARCSAPRARAVAKKLRSRSNRVTTSPCTAQIASSSAAAIAAAAGTAAARAGGIGTECRAGNSADHRRGRAPRRRLAKIRPRSMRARAGCSPPMAAMLDASRRSSAIFSNCATKPTRWRSTSRRPTRCASTGAPVASWRKHSGRTRWRTTTELEVAGGSQSSSS